MPLPKESRYTLADALTWDEHECIELIDGAPVMMAPPSRAHQEISGALFAQLHNYLEGEEVQSLRRPLRCAPLRAPWRPAGGRRYAGGAGPFRGLRYR